MKKLFVTAMLMMAGYVSSAQANDLGFQGGLSGSFGILGHYEMDKKLSIRGFYNSTTVTGVGVNSIGAAVEYRFQPNIYGALGLQQVNLTGTASGWVAGVASYLAVGYTDKLSGRWSWHGEFNNFQQLAAGVTYSF